MPRPLPAYLRITLLVLLAAVFCLPARGWASPAALSTAPATSRTPVTGPPSLSLTTVQRIVARTPLSSLATVIYQFGQQRQIDPAFALAIWTHESSLDTAGASVRNKNPGNLICAAAAHPPATGCSGRWAVYPDLVAAIADWYRYIAVRYVQRGLTTVETILPIYAPPSENDTQGYIAQVKRLMQQWRGGAVQPVVSTLVAIRTAYHPEATPHYERVVFEFNGALPLINVHYVNQLIAAGSPINIAGSAILQVRMTPGQAHDMQGRATVPLRIASGLPMVKEVTRSEDAEAFVTYGIGLTQKAEIRVITLGNPSRVVVDVLHP